MGGVNYCCIPGCRTRYGRNRKFADKSHIALFSQPKSEEELYRWSKAIQRTDKKLKIGDKVCELHFTEDRIIRYFETLLPDGTLWRIKRTKYALKPGSIPTIFPDVKNVRNSKRKKSENSIKISPEKQKIPKNTYSCLKKRKILNKNLECQPSTLNKDHEHSIMIANDKSSENAEIAANKNSEHSVITIKNVTENAEICENNNSEHSIMAIENVPENAEIVENENLEHLIISINNVPVNSQIVKNENPEYPTMTLNYDGPENVETIENENSGLAKVILNEIAETFTYSTLVNNLKLISRPDWSWGISVHDEFIMCAKWNKDSTLMKRVIINCNLKIRVFLKNRAVDFNSVKISSIKDLSSILMEVDTYRMCVNVNNREKAKCDGYILPKMKSIQCEYCRLIGDWEVNKKHTPYWLSKGRNFAKHQLLYEKINILNKENALLKEQLSKIIKIKAVWKLSNQTNPNPIED